MAKKFLNIEIDASKFLKSVDKAVDKVPEAATRVLAECAIDLAARSALRAPIESGDLRNDCRATVNGAVVYSGQNKGGSQPMPQANPQGTVGYSLPYAMRQHEELTWRHDRTDGYRIMTGKNAGRTVNMVAGGEAKFLERPFEENKDAYTEKMKKAVIDAIG